ncbi:MAG: purine-nucleoside phosphorylase [Omnitrophica WOR_2 bacterium GWF2_38_59]|nr:MAG: purine-nucleoside phosphorylase [Omnitrophica WOR_2 bacterium GWA2_37_7]OGX24104.1 MAG: purine-nucleoside phosphorylase [Omnitrophica WOR_2 bacterium GWF2_38_59]OGX50713.1 MAG: purine-nucleoside phosphorylase [Omnitrophica WOR_2 bacterium RIFOXYA12_FULL_38_10]OGX51329.1 MAG: purine-nucleoside phosphorylase [Omnitrophica WOR_2 bacterium RIFOXYA2_FULL_38_17]OGX54980.1 MAG: purine-nucleoside phosphorylase [Omnitrophica WOR_2 bacterium RIFOXYC2_FULL_38_12]OGX55730.1 MAG: purine-nucleoside 
MIGCSACLLGVACRYDGKSKPDNTVIEFSKKERLFRFCPELLGGLPAPRARSEIRGDKVINEHGEDITEFLKIGAEKVLDLLLKRNIKKVILKQNSPSCGCGIIYDGTFTGRLIKGDGITTALLKKNGIEVVSEKELCKDRI